MDKTFNDLMDIVNRTKKIDGSDRPRPRPRPREEVEEEYAPREYDVVEEKPKRTRTVKKDSPDLFAGSSVEKLLEKKTTKKATTTKKTTTAKKTPAKSATKTEAKTTPAKKTSTPKVSKPKLTKDDVLSEIEVKIDKPKKTTTPKVETTPVNSSDPKNAQLYEALKNSLFSGGTDISEYMEMQEDNEARASLQELKAKREAHKINEEITKEQQEYEQLFNGSFESEFQNSQLENFDEEEEEGETVDVAEKTAKLASELNAIRNNLAQKKNNPTPITQVNTNVSNKKDETYELETGNRDLDRKIAEYYKRKQEKINAYNAREEEGYIEEEKKEEGPVDYEAIFGGSMMTRDELLGIEREPEEEPSEVENEEVVKTEEVVEEAPTEEEVEEVELQNAPVEEEDASVEDAPEIEEEAPVEETLEVEDIPVAEEVAESEKLTAEVVSEEEPIEELATEEDGEKESPFAELARRFGATEEYKEEPIAIDNELQKEDDTPASPVVVDEQATEEVEEPQQDSQEDEVNEREEENKESHIKSLLSDLLFSKKIYPTDNVDEEEKPVVEEEGKEPTAEETAQVADDREELPQEENKSNYESIWNETLMGGINNPDNNVTSEESQEDVAIEESQEERQEEPQEELSDEELLDSLSLSVGAQKEEGEDTVYAEEESPVVERENETIANEQESTILSGQESLNIPSEKIYTAPQTSYEPTQEVEESGVIDGQEGFLPEDIQKSPSFEDEEMLGVESVEEAKDNVNIYDLSSNANDLSDYILTGNAPIQEEEYRGEEEAPEYEEEASEEPVHSEIEEEPIYSDEAIYDEPATEESIQENKQVEEPKETSEEEYSNNNMTGDYDEHFESVVNNERLYENTQRNDYSSIDDDPEDNTCVVETLPENRYDLFGNAIQTEEEEKEEVEEKKEDTISKEEFYNEMARLQENLINQLKGNATTESRDFFAEKDPEEEVKEEETANKLVDDIIEEYDNDTAEEFEASEEVEEPTEEEVTEEPICKAEPVDPEHYDDYNLLGKEEPLNDNDLEYQEKSEEEKTPEKDAYFYLSPEDNEKKAQEVDEYVQLFNEDSVQKEVGDIHIFKTIGNASPSSEILKDLETSEEPKVEEENKGKDEEVEAIYTLMGIERKPVAKAQADMKVLYVASECQPFVASGGLGDVAGSLPKAIARKGGVDIRVILPLYSSIKAQYRDKFEYLGNFTVHLSWRQEYCGLFRYYKDGVTYYFVDNERYFKRDKLYGYYDDGERFAYFSKAVVEALPYLNFFPDIIHCNDWQSSLVSAYIKTGNWSDFRYYKIKNIYTIHNVEYQGVYGMENLKDLFGIDNRFRNDMEYNGDINLTKAAIQYSDRFTTVSKSYCDNLKQPYCSRGLHHIIIRNEYKLSGIVNGIDYDFYNPATDTSLFKNYDFGCIEDKILNKKSWQDEMGLPVDGNTPMIAIVSRLVNHKGIDLVMKVMEEILDNDVQLVVVGTGEEKYVNYFKYLEGKYPTKVRALVDEYSNENARKAYASSDIFLMPSKIEPCGISQMIASRYGCVPVVREVGGLKDTIKDFGCEGGGNGYTFTNYNPNDLKYQLNRAIRDYESKSGWREKMKVCMSVDFTWDRPAEEYIRLYKSLYETM